MVLADSALQLSGFLYKGPETLFQLLRNPTDQFLPSVLSCLVAVRTGVGESLSVPNIVFVSRTSPKLSLAIPSRFTYFFWFNLN